MEFCGSTSEEFVNLVWLQQNDDEMHTESGMILQATASSFKMLIVCFEAVCYIWIFCECRKQNLTMQSHVSNESFQQKRKRNVINLLGQSINFVIEILVGCGVGMAAVFVNKNQAYFHPAIIPAVVCGYSSISAVTFIIASPEIRRFVVHKYIRGFLMK